MSRIVILRSRSEGNVRLAITPGTVQPKPMSIGTTLRPESPILRNNLSITNATRAMYPLSSSMERKKNSVTMTGRKFKTLPTPVKIPSMTSECSTGFTFAAVMPRSTISVSAPMPMSSKSDKNAPMTLNVSQNTRPIMPINAGIAVYLPVKTRSIATLLACSRLSFGFTTVAPHTF